MITATRLHAKRAAQGASPEPPPALVPYQQHQSELRALAQKYEAQIREMSPGLSEGSIVVSAEQLEEYSSHVRAVELELSTVVGKQDELRQAFDETWANAEKAAHRVLELEAALAEKDALIAELQKPKAEATEQHDQAENVSKSAKKPR